MILYRRRHAERVCCRLLRHLAHFGIRVTVKYRHVLRKVEKFRNHQIRTRFEQIIPMPNDGEQEDDEHRRFRQRKHDRPVCPKRSRTVNSGGFLQYGRQPAIKLDENKNEQCAFQSVTEQRRKNKRHMGVYPPQIAEEDVQRHYDRLRRNQERKHDERQPKRLAREPVPGKPVTDNRAAQYLKNGAADRNDDAVYKSVPITDFIKCDNIVEKIKVLRYPLNGGVGDVLNPHQRLRNHVQQRVQKDERQAE